ncbi:hypothetical protein Nepgr_007446 [Nepenthes gracilis]|uniref:Uncharacterized protein n=1 Tax=Nepenthes gracilis TaxID=150966 RepID=A0AAD3S776_NEPGR|nr:hypothetical protein Nepgr_007446 [Nepenthes gracilis]
MKISPFAIPLLLLVLLLVSASGLDSEEEGQLCASGTIEMERCSIPQCDASCRRKVMHSIGKCIAVDTCCCSSRLVR